MKPELFAPDRRSLLKKAGALGIGALASFVLPPESSYAFLFRKKKHKVVKTRLAMGTFVSMTAVHSSRDQAEQAIELAFAEVSRLSKLLSRHDNGSPVSQLNHTGVLHDAPRELCEVITASIQLWQQSGGAFDVTIKPLLDYYEQSFEKNQEPVADRITELLGVVGGQHLQLTGKTLKLARPDMAITLDGIAKGYIVDRASDVLIKNGISDHLVNAGGDIRAMGAPSEKAKWKIAIQDPEKKQSYPEIVEITNGAIATSGNYEIYYDQERLFHHIIDPKTGRSPQESVSVTVRTNSAMRADGLATGVFVLGPQDGVKMVESHPATWCYVLDASGKPAHSSGWDNGSAR